MASSVMECKTLPTRFVSSSRPHSSLQSIPPLPENSVSTFPSSENLNNDSCDSYKPSKTPGVIDMSLDVQISGGGGSSRAGSAASGRSGLWVAGRWEYDHSPIPENVFKERILDSKLRPRANTTRKESHGPPRVKRELSEDLLTSSAIPKSRRTSSIPTQQRSMSNRVDHSTGTPEPHDLVSVKAKRPRGPSRRADTREKQLNTSQLRRQNELLQREMDLLNIHRNHKIVSLEERAVRLQEANKELHRMLDHYREIDKLIAPGFKESSDVILDLTTKLKQKDQQLEGKMNQITSLYEQLGAQEWLLKTNEDLNSDFTCSSSLSKGLAGLNQATQRIAALLAQCLSSRAVLRIWKQPSKEPALHSFVKKILGTARPLNSNRLPAIQALIFAFVRDRIFFSNSWAALHFEGYMLRGLHQFIQKTSPSGTLESLHRASIEDMLSGDHQFEHCWIRKEMEDIRLQFLELLCPVFDNEELIEVKDQVNRDLAILFTDALKVRARFVSPIGCRYQILQFKPGELFDPDFMEVSGANLADAPTLPSSGPCKIKFCIHGCLVEHQVSDDCTWPEFPQSLNRPLIHDHEGFHPTERGILKSGKAIVVLEH